VLSARCTLLPGQEPTYTYDAAAEVRIAVAMNAALGVEAHIAPGDAQAVLWSFLYF
jgi:hypothetical protein